ncbi:MAG TPA: MBL fold metallo-hydrolase [Thermoanaerobaculia bacterium]|nr:MBL fold metallo-hydrolase [Thermoanaerobaculia bacterium]
MTAPIILKTPRFTIEGKSRAGNETWLRIRELDLAFDIGRCPDELVPVPNVFISHAHIDHAMGVPLYAAQRGLQGMPRGRVHVPRESLAGFQELIAIHERLEHCSYELDLVGVAPGESISLHRNLEIRAHAASHRVPALAYEVVETRRKLKQEFRHLTGNEIAELRRGGGEATDSTEVSTLFYTGDTDRGILVRGHPMFHAEVLVAECSFTAPEDYARAERYRHLHFDDLCEVSDEIQSEIILLIHFSLRDSPASIHANISRRCPQTLRERIRLGLAEPFMRL